MQRIGGSEVRAQAECAIERRCQLNQSNCGSAGDEVGVGFGAPGGQVAYVVGRYQHVMVIDTEEKGTKHREEERPDAGQDVTRP